MCPQHACHAAQTHTRDLLGQVPAQNHLQVWLCGSVPRSCSWSLRPQATKGKLSTSRSLPGCAGNLQQTHTPGRQRCRQTTLNTHRGATCASFWLHAGALLSVASAYLSVPVTNLTKALFCATSQLSSTLHKHMQVMAVLLLTSPSSSSSIMTLNASCTLKSVSLPAVTPQIATARLLPCRQHSDRTCATA